MAELSTLARPYAKAAFDYANEHGVVENWEYFLLTASAIVQDVSFDAILNNPAITAEQKASILIDIYNSQVTSEASVQQVATQAIKNFVQQLSEHERLSLLPEIYEHYRRHKSQALKQVDAYVTSAYPLTETQRVLIQSRLASSLNASVVLHESVDSTLLAGATIKIGDKIVDDSVRGKLKQLKTQLNS